MRAWRRLPLLGPPGYGGVGARSDPAARRTGWAPQRSAPGELQEQASSRRSSIEPRKITVKSAPLARPADGASATPDTDFHGSFGACREDEQGRTIPSQPGSLDDFPLKRSQAYRSNLIDAERCRWRPARKCPGFSCSDGILHEVVEHGEVGVPPIQDRRHLAEPHGFGGGVSGELVADPAAGDDDAGLSVSAQEHT